MTQQVDMIIVNLWLETVLWGFILSCNYPCCLSILGGNVQDLGNLYSAQHEICFPPDLKEWVQCSLKTLKLSLIEYFLPLSCFSSVFTIVRVCPHSEADFQMNDDSGFVISVQNNVSQVTFLFTNVNWNWISLSLVEIKCVSHVFLSCMDYFVFTL